MSEEKFNIVFRGVLVKGADLVQTKANIGKLFKVQGATLENLFSGKGVTLKKNLDFDTAQKYRVAIKKAGAQIELVDVAQAPEPAKLSSGKAQFGTQESQLKPKEASRSAKTSGSSALPKANAGNGRVPVLGGVEEAVAKQVSVDVPNVEVAALGERLGVGEVDESSIEVDTSALSVRAAEGDLIDESERVKVHGVKVETAHLQMDEVGSDLLKSSERKVEEELVLDLSALSIAEVGGRLSEPKEEAASAPDTSHLKIVN